MNAKIWFNEVTVLLKNRVGLEPNDVDLVEEDVEEYSSDFSPTEFVEFVMEKYDLDDIN